MCVIIPMEHSHNWQKAELPESRTAVELKWLKGEYNRAPLNLYNQCKVSLHSKELWSSDSGKSDYQGNLLRVPAWFHTNLNIWHVWWYGVSIMYHKRK